jgi:pimeloyl-ACP methyl ester carboxylesterase
MRIGKKVWSRTITVAATSAVTLLWTVMPVAAHAQGLAIISLLPAGTVTEKTAMALPADLQPIATGKRIKYVSTDPAGKKIIVSGAIITPKIQLSQPKTVAWAHGTTGLGDQCTPSQNLAVFWPEAVAAVKSYIQHGWTVAATDYPGLGTPDAHPYLMGDSEARAVIDSVRAARNLDVKLTNKWVVSGHSQGGQASLFAGEIADTYGIGLSLKGAVAMAPASNFDIIGPAIAGTPGQGLLVAALLGLSAVDSSVNVDTILAQPAKDKLGVFQTGCYFEILDAYANLTPSELLTGGQLPQNIIDKLAQNGNPAQQASVVPVMLTQGTADETVPADLTYLLDTQICSYGTPTYLQVVEGADHEGAVLQTLDSVANYIQARFNGAPAPANCQ